MGQSRVSQFLTNGATFSYRPILLKVLIGSKHWISRPSQCSEHQFTMGVVSKTSLGDGGGSDRKLTVHSAVTELLLILRTDSPFTPPHLAWSFFATLN
jgi:aminopeptidase-like protein